MKLLDKKHHRLGVIFMILALLVYSAHGVNCFELSQPVVKESIVESIAGYSTNVSFAVLFQSRAVAFDRCEQVLPQAWRFGLSAVESVIDSRWADGVNMPANDGNLLFLYESDRHAEVTIDKKPHGYVGSPHFAQGICRLVFMTAQRMPIGKRYNQIELVPGGTLVTPLEKLWISKGIDKDKYLDEFSRRVFKTCDGGAFCVDLGCAQKILGCMKRHRENGLPMNNDAWDNQLYMEDVALNAREISEVVYWLWLRDGKEGKYPELSRRNPELFEPIGDISEFKTEIGHMLVARSKK